jgi:hypothetical protein
MPCRPAVHASSRRLPCRAQLFLALALIPALALAQDPNQCDEPGDEPDVKVGDLHQTERFGAVGGITGFSVGTISCNIGSCWLNWDSGTSDHPVIAQNMFRLKDGRFEQVGQSWVKHGFFAVNGDFCSTECIPAPDGSRLGVNCSDPYSAGLNGNQTRLGPRSEVNPSTGVFPYPFTTFGVTGDDVYKRLQVHNVDLNPTLNPGAQYFVEGQYVAADDAAAGNSANNNAYRPITVTGSDPVFDIGLTGTTVEQPAVDAWAAADPGVHAAAVDITNDGQFLVYSRAADLGNGTWHYEYAVQNLTSHRAAGSFEVPLKAGAQLQNIGFHDVDYHSGEPYSGFDWGPQLSVDSISWSTTDHGVDPNANALRWGTLYNFRFDADVPPVTGEVTLGLFLPGIPSQVQVAARIPSQCNNDGTCAGEETCSDCADCVILGAPVEICCGDMICDPMESTCQCAADCGLPPAQELFCDDGVDEDCDGDIDCADLDCCDDAACTTGIDGDGDGVADCDCDDGNNQAWALPGEAQSLVFGADGTSLSWQAPAEFGGESVTYDLLRSPDRDFVSLGQCLTLPDPAVPSGSDSDTPPSGILFYYLVRAVNGCPEPGTLGTDGAGTEREGPACP